MVHAVTVDEEEITVDGEFVDIALEYTPGDRVVAAEGRWQAAHGQSRAAPHRLQADHARVQP